MKDTFRMYYFDISLWSSKEWRISHCLSHHLYPNTIWDMEMYSFEPVFNWMSGKNKPMSFFSIIISPAVWSLIFIGQAIKR